MIDRYICLWDGKGGSFVPHELGFDLAALDLALEVLLELFESDFIGLVASNVVNDLLDLLRGEVESELVRDALEVLGGEHALLVGVDEFEKRGASVGVEGVALELGGLITIFSVRSLMKVSKSMSSS